MEDGLGVDRLRDLTNCTADECSKSTTVVNYVDYVSLMHYDENALDFCDLIP